MNISYRWLRSIAPTIEGTPEEIGARMGLLGAPVDEMSATGVGLVDIVIARVEEVRPHPDADRLRLCSVNAGGAPLQVVCGAPNVEAGAYYPFAPIGATLPGGMQIGRAKLRGQLSEGMLCSAKELGLGRDHAGLMTLHGEWQPGSRLLEQLEIDDVRLVIDITPNRSDLLSHIGVARELAPGGIADVRLAPFSASSRPIELLSGTDDVQGSGIRVVIEDAADCPRYVAAVIEGVRVAPSPEWLATRLRAIGVRPINNVVDATNFVLHELGQPLHAFDLDTLAGPEIRVRRASKGEVLRTLDGIDRVLDSSALVIADRERPVALAGVMGGQATEVTEATTRVLIECALFDPRVVRKGARSFGLSTDASHRFERGVDWAEQTRAIERVVDLILATAGGSLVSPVLDAHPKPAAPASIVVRPDRVLKVLGVDLSAAEIASLIEPIGFAVGDGSAELSVEPPSYRPDVTREIDVIEEIARRRGYDTFESALGHYRPGVVPVDAGVELHRAAHALFARWGFMEARTAAFARPGDSRVALLNPLSAEESHLRDDLVTGLLRRTEHNWAHGVRSIRLYEIGTVFRPSSTSIPDEEIRLAAVFTGASRPPHWADPARSYDVWDVKSLVTELSELIGARIELRDGRWLDLPVAADESFVLTQGGMQVGYGGRVPDRAMDRPAWAEPVWAVEVSLRRGVEQAISTFSGLPTFPAVERDLAMLIGEGVSSADVDRVVRERGGAILEAVWPFDVYEGEGIARGSRSIAWRLRFRSEERTLTDAEVEIALANILTGLEEELGVRRR